MNVMKRAKVIAVWLAVALLSSMLTACDTLEVGIEHTPTPDHAATATVSALATENARLATQVATLAVPTSTPTPSLGKLAYVQGGDVWVKALPDGEPQRLTTDGRNSTPRWSPSGQWLAFRKGDYQVWLMSADGKDARPLNEGAAVDAFAWVPADDRLAYVAAAGLQIISADGAAPTTLVPDSLPGRGPGQMGRIAWSPDGDWIAYEWYEKEPKGPLAYQGLWRVSSDGEQLTELYASGAPEKGEAILAGWSLDGQHVLFWQGDILSASMLADGVPLYSLPAGGGEPTKLADTVLVHDDFLAPAPQDDRLAVTAGGYRATWTNKRVAVVGAGDGELAWLTDDSVTAFAPAWSPDGIHLAYVAMPDEGDLVGGDNARLGMMERRIWVVNLQGQPQPQQLTDDPAYRDERPLWSADGSHLLFARMDAEGGASLWLIPAAGDESRQVVDELTPLPGPASGWFGYYGYVEWDQLFDWWRGPVRAPEGIAAPTPGPPPTARPPVSPTPTPPPPTPTTVLTAPRTYTDTALGFAIDYPADWVTDGVQGEFVWLSNPATSGEERQAINIAALAEPSLEAMLDNVEQGSFGPYLIMAEPIQLGGLEALKVTLRQAPEGLSLLWLVITPQGQGLTIAAYGDPALAEAIVATWRPVLLPNATAMSQPTVQAQDLAPGTETVIDCADIYPGLPGCLGETPLVRGRLAFVDTRHPFDGHPFAVDLERGRTVIQGKWPGTLIGWSPSGEYLLVLEDQRGRTSYSAYAIDGLTMASCENLAVPPFWGPSAALPRARNWLAVISADGAVQALILESEPYEVLPPGSLGHDGRGVIRWSHDNWLAWSLNTNQLATAGQWEQTLYVRPVESEAETTTWRLSDDIREAYYQIIDWVPGTRLILAAQGMMAVSLWSWGVPLVTINADTGEITDLNAAMLLTPEAYAWHPTQPGLLALAEGGSRYLFETGHLALLDVTSGELTYLTGEDVAAFEPAWSPDGTLLAYAAVSASPDASGDGTTLEHTLDGRAIYVVDPQSGETYRLTDPGDVVDGWPQWSTDGTRLLYTRQHDGYTDVRVVTLDGKSDQLLVTGLPDAACYYTNCPFKNRLLQVG